MTREEAYNRIDAIIARHEIDDEYVTITSLLDYDALRMARKALEQATCEDAISRQAVLEYIEGSEAELGHSSENELVCQYFKELPPVAPRPSLAEIGLKFSQIPDNATNGDVIKALFYVKNVEEMECCTFVSIAGDADMRVYKDWWNAPFAEREVRNEV